MFALMGTPEYIAIGVLIVVLFGAKKLPELGRSLGQGIKEFRKASKGILEDEEEKKDEPAASR